MLECVVKRRFDFKLFLGVIGLSAMAYSTHIFLDQTGLGQEETLSPASPALASLNDQALVLSDRVDCEAFLRAHSVISDMASNI